MTKEKKSAKSKTKEEKHENVKLEMAEKSVKKDKSNKHKKQKMHTKKELAITAAEQEKPGVTSVELLLGLPDEEASCSFVPSTGRLTLKVPPAVDGQQGHQGAPGPRGKTGKGIDYSKAPDDDQNFFLFIDGEGRLCYSARGEAFFVNLTQVSPVAGSGAAED